ncbi:hypothetical protein ACFFHT_06280 [Gallibacterium melopsittaci]|uniref:DUF465 domain-containing protein n=1 Tax=Gallibacterium melopsittaci TaxID=516063 RepID=A0ABV6HWA3_9PAST
MNTDLEKIEHIHRVQKQNLKERIDMVQKGGLVDEIQKKHLRHRVKTLSQVK